MKKIIFSPLIFLVVNCKDLHAQTLKDSPEQLIAPALSNYYTGKAKQQKTAGLVLTGLGVAMVVAGFGIAVSDLDFGLSFDGSQSAKSSSDFGTAEIFVTLGGISLVSAIPLLISSAHNRKKAKLLLQNQTTRVTPSFYLIQQTIGIAIALGN